MHASSLPLVTALIFGYMVCLTAAGAQKETSSSSPLAADCQTLADDLGEHQWKGFMMYNCTKDDLDGPYLGLQTSSTCTFGIKVLDPPPRNNAPIILGNTDARDIVRDALLKFTADGRVGASGVMGCQAKWADYDAHEIAWRIFDFGA
ncbi:putative necrosis-inducing factor-domain-containing protein [Xylariaceae sp. FL1651]|nr:putative necrosis-inducing factor-domain-containing protein [Xylariaceae sp. FL1651]